MTLTEEGSSPHPTAQTISAYLDRSLPQSEAIEVETHLDSCADCRADLVQVAAILRGRRRRRRLAMAVPALAAAAVLVLVVRSPAPPLAVDRFRADTTASGASFPIAIVTPPEAAVLSRDSIFFRWRGMAGLPGSTLYRVTLTDERGGVLWTSETRDTMVALSGVRISANGIYLWYVDALLPGARTATTGVHSFRTAP